MTTRKCGTCRYWDIHSIGSNKGDCRAPGQHRYWRGSFGIEGDKSRFHLDSFGAEVTTRDYGCGAWDDGADSPPFDPLAAKEPT